MRQLKFRIWNGSEMQHDVLAGNIGAFWVNTSADKDGLNPNDKACLSLWNTKINDVHHIMEFTGLQDKNGKDVYEGDRLEHVNDKRILVWGVQFKNGVFGIVNINDDRKSDFYPCDGSQYYFSDREVIGHCYSPSQKTEA